VSGSGVVFANHPDFLAQAENIAYNPSMHPVLFFVGVFYIKQSSAPDNSAKIDLQK
jgi:hypothetical protein